MKTKEQILLRIEELAERGTNFMEWSRREDSLEYSIIKTRETLQEFAEWLTNEEK